METLNQQNPTRTRAAKKQKQAQEQPPIRLPSPVGVNQIIEQTDEIDVSAQKLKEKQERAKNARVKALESIKLKKENKELWLQQKASKEDFKIKEKIERQQQKQALKLAGVH